MSSNNMVYSEDEDSGMHHNYDDIGSQGMTIRVIAPATLSAGYTFDVLLDGAAYRVEVPEGGVKEGQEFDVPYEPEKNSVRNLEMNRQTSYRHYDDEETTAFVLPERYSNEYKKGEIGANGTMPLQTMSEGDEEEEDSKNAERKDPHTGAPMGRWRTHLCSCCDVVTQSTFWMGLCCTPVLLAQLITRFGLAWNGREGTPEEQSLSFNRIVVGMLIALALFKLPGIGGFVLVGYYCLIVGFVGARVRSYVRQKYEIPASLPDKFQVSRLDDGCCMLFCGCCSAIQMARHTHDDKEYPGHGCTTTGIGMHAPQVV